MNYTKNVIWRSLSKDRRCTWQHLPGKLLALAAPCCLSCPTCCSHTCTGIQTGRIVICRGQGEEEEALSHRPFFSRTSTLRSCPKTQAWRWHKGRRELTGTDWDQTPNLKTVLENTEGVACLDPKRGIPNSSTLTLLGQGHCCCWWSQKGKLDTASSKICSSNLWLSILTETHQREFWK